MRVRWLKRALNELDYAREYIAQERPLVAEEVAARLLTASRTLGAHPFMGRSGRVKDTREFVVLQTPFILMYRVKDEEVQILTVLHHARQWP